MRKRLAETHGTIFELVRHFFACMFDSELFSTRGQWRGMAIGAVALALPAGMALLDSPYFYKGLDQIRDPDLLRAGAIADQLSWLILAFSLTGLLAVLSWQSLLPGRRDYLLFAGLPVTSRQIFIARFISMALFALGLVSALNLLPSVLTPHQFTANWDTGASLSVNAASRFIPACLGCLVVFFSIVSLQGLLLNLLPGRWFVRVSTLIQGLLIGAFFLSALSTWFVVDMGPQALKNLFSSRIAALPVWFGALSRVMSGDRDPVLAEFSRRAWAASLGAPVLAMLVYLLSYRRSKRLLLESPDLKMSRKRRWSLLRPLARSSEQEAILQFMAATIARSRTHRLVVLGYLGAAVAIMLNAILLLGGRFGGVVNRERILQFIVLYWPIGISIVMIAAIRHAFLIPAELRANWIFQATESHGRADWMTAVERFVMACVIAPVILVFAPVGCYVMGWRIGARMSILQLLIALAIFDLLFYSWQQLPFTCSYVPGKRPLVALLGIWLYVMGVVVPVLSILAAVLSQMMELFAAGATLLTGLWLWLRHRRREGWGESRLMYEDIPGAITNLGIKDVTYATHPSAAPRRPLGDSAH